MDALECAAATHRNISRLGGGFMVAPCVGATAERLGLSFMEFYVVGRSGVLGPSGADGAAAALALVNPAVVNACWESAAATQDPRDVAVAYAGCCGEWGRERMSGLPESAQAVGYAQRLVDALELDDLPLVRGWQSLPLPADAGARLAQLFQTLREFRGALHARAVIETGLHPVEAIVSGPDGPDRARLLGWDPPFPAADAFVELRALAETRTNVLAAQPFSTLRRPERAALVRLCAALVALVYPARVDGTDLAH